jgi:hypothetical protein
MAEHTPHETVADTDVKVPYGHFSQKMLLLLLACLALPTGHATHISPCSS